MLSLARPRRSDRPGRNAKPAMVKARKVRRQPTRMAIHIGKLS